ncbi:hypothetical protein N7495_005408 [Penicillium taxi]|uniref:uncharacterized protein n=1 Tax=Penicillium taxi TaxID=168475 RepID=UPI002545B576|nr:uncharacterized protein N7495_005408 [Penicillium taxi]KAJ5893717.1 hypothetical protein N7495_005408 [Penicillium taxi]
MDCFRQIFRCIKAPFKRQDDQRPIEIGHPTDFRKEELPACFSDAESVVSPSQAIAEPPILTKQSQNIEAPEQPRNNSGDKDGSGDRDGGALATDEEKKPEPHSEEKQQAGESRRRMRIKVPRLLRFTKSAPVKEDNNKKQ